MDSEPASSMTNATMVEGGADGAPAAEGSGSSMTNATVSQSPTGAVASASCAPSTQDREKDRVRAGWHAGGHA